ncbi:MAG: autotransporter-associated beta strand repeat-containing protein [Verrucomicrobiota bacterium]
MKMQSFPSRIIPGLALCALMPFALNTARAATWGWDGATDPSLATGASLNTTTNGEDWLSDGYWDNDSVVETLSSWTDGDSAIFGGDASSQTITVDALTIGNLTFGQGPQGAGASGTAYTLSGGAITLSGNTAITNNTDTTISSLLAGSGSLTKWGAATLTLSPGMNTYTGGTTVNSGTLFANAYNSASGAVGGGNVTINNGGAISVGGDNSFVGGSPLSSSTITINTGGLVTSTNGAVCHLCPLVLNGGTLSATTENDYYGNWDFDGGVSTPGNGSSSFISGGNASLTQSGGTVFDVGANDTLTVSCTLGGAWNVGCGGLIKNGGGTLILAADSNPFCGGTTVNAGTIYADAGNSQFGALGQGSVTVNNGGTISVGGDNSFVGGSPSPSSIITINAGGLVDSTYGASCHLSPLVLNGGTLNATTVNPTYGNWNFDYGVSTPGNGASSFITGGNAALTQSGGTVFNIGANDTLTVSCTLGGASFIPGGGLIKTGAGTLTLTGVNSSTAEWIAAAGTLNGTGSIAAPVWVQPGGTLAAGTPSSLGALFISNSLTLQGNVNLRINSSTSASDQLSQMNGVVFGGTLTVTDLGNSLASGESFTLFQIAAGAYSGGFAGFNLPALPTGLSWNLSLLPVNGSISVTNAAGAPIFYPPPGGYTSALPVTFGSLTPGATVYYTTNGLTPSAASLSAPSPVTVVMPLNSTVTIQAYAHESGYTDSTVVTGTYTTVPGSVWTNVNGGSWSFAANWTNDIIAEGGGVTADFSHLTLPGNETVTLDGAVTVGQLIFGDLGNQYEWYVNLGIGTTLTLAATNTPTITVNNQSATITATIAGTNGLAKLGPGTLTLTGANTYSGGTTISNGTLATLDFATLGTGAIYIGSNGAYSFTTDGYNQPTFPNPVSGGGAFNAYGSGGNQSFWSGDWSGFSGTLTIGAGGTGWWTDSANTGSTTMKINMIGGGGGYGCFLGAYALESGITLTYNIGELTGGAGSSIFGQPSTANNITLSVGALGTSTTYAGMIWNNWNYATDTSSTMNLTKVGAGTFTLSGTNTYTGATTVSNGALQVDGVIGTSAVTVQSGATLDGAGFIGGAVTVYGGGTLAAGDPSAVGALTISNTLTLGADSKTTLRLIQTTATNDSVVGVTTLTYGGALTVTNLAGTLAAGTSFQLFNATTYAGNFASTNLPPLGPGLVWNWTPSAGTLAVVPAPATITSYSELANGRFSLTFTGALGANYTVYATTNLSWPLSSWTVLTNGSFTAAPVNYQDTNSTNYPERFYHVALP